MTSTAAQPTPDELFEQIARIDLKVDCQRQLSERAEASLIDESIPPEERKHAIMAIALRDELIEELLERRRLLWLMLSAPQ